MHPTRSARSRTRLDDGERVADAAEQLHEVVEADDLAVAGVAREVVLVHDVLARRRRRPARAAAHLAGHARGVARVAVGPGLRVAAAEAVVVALAAHVEVQVAAQHLLAHVAAHAGVAEEAGAADRRVLAGRVLHAHLEHVPAVRARVLVDGPIVEEADAHFRRPLGSSRLPRGRRRRRRRVGVRAPWPRVCLKGPEARPGGCGAALDGVSAQYMPAKDAAQKPSPTRTAFFLLSSECQTDR